MPVTVLAAVFRIAAFAVVVRVDAAVITILATPDVVFTADEVILA